MALNLNNNIIKITDLGGIAVKLINKTGAPSVQGEVVEADSVVDNAVSLEAANGADPIGVFLDSGIADGDEAWIVFMGLAMVRADATGYSKGDRVVMSTVTNGRVEANNTPAAAAHFTELGHALGDAAANAVGKCMLHFL